ncbi:hypothetical protein MHU86_25186 [Fragilaria crotonensis]|nr:hypothetical protein MHU86_25186 [Fragilaria crotonensis]
MMMLDSCLIYQARAFFPVVAQHASNGGSFRSSLRRNMTPFTPVLAHQRRRLLSSSRSITSSISAHANEDNGDTSIRKNENIIDKQNAKRNHVMSRQLKREDRISFLEYSRKNGVELSIPEQKELQGLLSTNSDDSSDTDISNFVEQYSSLGFSEEHVAFKATHNQVFARLISYCQSKHADRTINVFYLDGPCGGTTEALLMSSNSSPSTTARFIEPYQCYTANRHASTCRALQQRFPAVHVQHASAEDALLQTSVPFHAFYFDACGGHVPMIVDMMRAALVRKQGETVLSWQPPVAMGFSILGGGRDCVDKEQEVIQALVQMVKPMKCRVARVGDDPEMYGIDDVGTLVKVESLTMTTWVMIERD